MKEKEYWNKTTEEFHQNPLQAYLSLHKKALSPTTELKAIPLKVGMTRFELATPRPPDVCATGLRYIPKTKGFRRIATFGMPLIFALGE